jgi:hypothetical protein
MSRWASSGPLRPTKLANVPGKMRGDFKFFRLSVELAAAHQDLGDLKLDSRRPSWCHKNHSPARDSSSHTVKPLFLASSLTIDPFPFDFLNLVSLPNINAELLSRMCAPSCTEHFSGLSATHDTEPLSQVH